MWIVFLKQILAILGFYLLTACSAMFDLHKLQPGMTTEQVYEQLGKPGYRCFDRQCERWEYRKPVVGGTKVVVVSFEKGRVVAMDSFFDEASSQSSANHSGGHVSLGILCGNEYVTDSDFRSFMSQVKSYFSDNERTSLIRKWVSNKRITCEQCVQLMQLYILDSDRMEILEILAPRLTDRQNSALVLDLLQLQSEKLKAKHIIEINR